MAYDAIRSRIVLFGGGDGVGTLMGDTWEWNGSAWAQIPNVNGPSARQQAVMAFDAARGRVVLFGGFDGTNGVSDLWQWSGSAWTQIQATGPNARFGPAAAYDSGRSRMVIFGGAEYFQPQYFSTLSDTWEFGTDAPAILTQPVPGRIANGSTLSLSVGANAGTLSFRWRKAGVPLNNGASAGGGVITGATGPLLNVTAAQSSDAGSYDCIVTSTCGSTTSIAVAITIFCPADFDDGTGTGTTDDGVTVDDLLFYLGLFMDGDVRADLDDGNGIGVHDGGVTLEDLLYFLFHFDLGC